MEGMNAYCPMVGKCPYEPVYIKPNSYFLVQPFDREKEEREKAIGDALAKFYGSNKKYELKKADSKISNSSIYCDICLKIKASQFCIVDISGELHEIVDTESGKKEQKVFLQPNVALELGMAYGFNKPALILSRKLNGERLIPSDIKFVRYIDISLIKIGGWSVASQKLLNRLRELVPFRPIRESLDLDSRKLKEIFKKYYKSLLHSKERLPSLRNRNFRISQIVYRGGRPVGIIKDAEDLREDICFNFYVLEQELEQLVGLLKVKYVQPNGMAQVDFYKVEGGGDYLDEVAQHCFRNDTFVPGEHRLELVVPEEVENLKLKEIKDIIDMIS